jgi:TfuA protein
MSARIVFVGPSLRPPRPSSPEVQYRDPAARGDLLRAAEAGAHVIGLVDGVFHQDLTVSPGEVRTAARTGVRLFGGASLGALRACECPNDMCGVGEIWAAFSHGALTDDDEVAVTFVPDSFSVVAYPLVQVRETARLIALQYPQCHALAVQFVDAIRALPFQDRTLATIHRASEGLRRAGVPWVQIESLMTDPTSDIKRRDALAVFKAVVEA